MLKITILGSTINIIEGDLYDHLICTRISTMIMNKTFIRVPKFTRKVGYNLDLDLLTVSYKLIVSCSRRTGLVGETNHLGPTYLITNLMCSLPSKLFLPFNYATCIRESFNTSKRESTTNIFHPTRTLASTIYVSKNLVC